MLIIGAGISGLLAAQYFRSTKPTVLELQESLPNNHKALLRFRTSAVGDLTGMRFKEVEVMKALWDGENLRSEATLAEVNLYSQKVTGQISDRSISDLYTVYRYIAPDDFVKRLSEDVDIEFGIHARNTVERQKNGDDNEEPLISTIPVQTLAGMLGYSKLPDLVTKPIWTMTANIVSPVCDVYQTVYTPYSSSMGYRISITGDRIICEHMEEIPYGFYEGCKLYFEKLFGICGIELENVEFNHQPNGKLIECPDRSVKDFISWASREHNIYSLGRWATHRQILIDDLVQDLQVIDKMIRTNGYER